MVDRVSRYAVAESGPEAVAIANVNQIVAFSTHYPVFPCHRVDKSPLTQRGFKDATQVEQQIRDWWRRWPDALVAVPTGHVSGLVLIDYDEYKGDPASQQWITEHSDALLAARIHSTRRGGRHFFFSSRDKAYRSLNGGVLGGAKRYAVDVKAEGGYVIWWPFHGGAIVQGQGDEAPPIPTGLIDELESGKGAQIGEFSTHTPIEWDRERPSLVAALGFVSPVDRDNWLRVGMALHDASAGSESGFQLWHSWASGSLTGHSPDGYKGEADCRYTWKHFASQRETVVRIGSLYALAAGEGWQRSPLARTKHPKPDIATLVPRNINQIAQTKVVGREWFFASLIPAGAFLIVGRPKVGKSWLLLQLALCAAGGGVFLGYESLLIPEVLYIAAEDDESRIQTRLSTYRLGEAPSGLHVVVRDEFTVWATEYSKHYSLPQFLDAYLEGHGRTKFVILDTETTCRQMWSGERVSRDASITRKDYQEVRDFDSLALKHSAFIGLVNHTSKRKNGSWFDIHELINRTNTALAGASGSIVLADPPDRDPFDEKSKLRVLGVRGRDLRDDILLAVEQNDLAVFENKGPFVKHQQTQAELQILEGLERLSTDTGGTGEQWFPAKAIAEEIGAKAGNVQRSISRMMRANRYTWKEWRLETKPKKGMRLLKKDA